MPSNPPETVVVNLYKEPFDVYIGRPGKGNDGYFGNPYTTGSREDNIKLFRRYFYKRIKEDPEFRNKVHNLKGKRLGCFCHPKPCHGDIIANYLNNLQEIKPINLAVVGSRNFHDYDYLSKILKWFNAKRIITGGAKGADSLAERYAAENGIPVKIHCPDWDRYGKSAGYKRNTLIVNDADELVAFWDGKSKGTQHSITLAQEKGIPVYTITPTKDETLEIG